MEPCAASRSMRFKQREVIEFLTAEGVTPKEIHQRMQAVHGDCVDKDEEIRVLKHYWYTSWPDQKTPDQAPPLLQLVQEVEEAMQCTEAKSGPIIVHCSAGIGRTGCFIATSICCKQWKNEGVVDILKTTCQLRLDRGGMIQTSEQYQFVHHVMSLYEKQFLRAAAEE